MIRSFGFHSCVVKAAFYSADTPFSVARLQLFNAALLCTVQPVPCTEHYVLSHDTALHYAAVPGLINPLLCLRADSDKEGVYLAGCVRL